MEDFQILDEENQGRRLSRLETLKNWILTRKWELVIGLIFASLFIGILYEQYKLYGKIETVEIEDIAKEEKMVENLAKRIEAIEKQLEQCKCQLWIKSIFWKCPLTDKSSFGWKSHLANVASERSRM